ncbi:centromere protein H (CENP-H)-domain-containing protein [Phaeosphaeriaceae sp. PMI808]|nr:centromere protein H (CENP-H)-domain-containing protein [Phaeosphaeriaceae sp. PMI808]
MAAKGDVNMVDAITKPSDSNVYADLLHTIHSDAFTLSKSERLALELHDHLRELELQQALLQAQKPDDEIQDQLTIAQRETMEAKAEYELRNRISHNVLVMDPVLKAVHGGERAGYAEKRILPLITENDTLSMLHGSLTTNLVSTQRAISAAEQANVIAIRKNRELSATMLSLAEEMKTQSAKDIEDPQLRDQVDAVDKGLKESMRKTRTLKGILSAMIVGSGINWAADEELTELVMEDEEDG